MANWLYNGIQFPDINEIWTDEPKAQYPYAYLRLVNHCQIKKIINNKKDYVFTT